LLHGGGNNIAGVSMITYKHFGIIPIHGEFIVYNMVKGFEGHHTHIKQKNIAYMICKLAASGKPAKKEWVAESIKRII
jgi:hypothetical protein